MNLPPLPESFPAGYIAKTEHFVTLEQAQAYGQQNAITKELSNEQ